MPICIQQLLVLLLQAYKNGWYYTELLKLETNLYPSSPRTSSSTAGNLPCPTGLRRQEGEVSPKASRCWALRSQGLMADNLEDYLLEDIKLPCTFLFT